MHNIDYEGLAERTWDNEILPYATQLHEHNGWQAQYLHQQPVEQKRLVETAKIQSTEASNRIEGIITTNARLKQLVADKTTPKNRDESEILGYRNVLKVIHENCSVIPINPNYILQLHRDLLKYTSLSYAGRFKTAPNEIDAMLPNGQKQVIFSPLEPYETPQAIEEICESFQKALGNL